MSAHVVTIDDVPDECLELALSFLNLRAVGHVRRACKRLHGLTSFAWNAAQTPAGRLRAVNAAPNGLARWVLAGAAGCETIVDNKTVPAVWREEIRALLAAAPANSLRTDRMPVGAFWEPQEMLQECLRLDSAEGLAFIAARGGLDTKGWRRVLSECLRARAPRMLAYTCAHSGLDAQAVYESIAACPSSPECYEICAEPLVPKPKPLRRFWLKAIEAGNCVALQWLGCSVSMLLTLGNSDGVKQKLIKKALAIMIRNAHVSRAMALWLRPFFAEAVASGWSFRELSRGKLVRVFCRFLLNGELESARLLADFYLAGEPHLAASFPATAVSAAFAGQSLNGRITAQSSANEKPSPEQAEATFEWFREAYLVCLPAGRRRILGTVILTQLVGNVVTYNDLLHARLMQFFGESDFELLFSTRVFETKGLNQQMLEIYRRWRADACARDSAEVFALEMQAQALALPNTETIVLYANLDSREFVCDYVDHKMFEEHLGEILQDPARVGWLNTLFLAAPKLMRAWLDDVDVSLPPVAERGSERLALVNFVNNSTISAARYLLHVGNFGSPAPWLKKIMDPTRGILFGAIARLRRRVPGKRRPGDTDQPENESVAHCCELLLSVAGDFKREVVQAVLLATAADLGQTEAISLELLEIAHRTDARYLRELMRTNLKFAAGVVHACAVSKRGLQHPPMVYRSASPEVEADRLLSVCEQLVAEAWTACSPAELTSACLSRLATPCDSWATTSLDKPFAQMLCARGISLQKLVAENRCRQGSDIAGYLARHGISAADESFAAYLVQFSHRECMRKFVKCMSRLGHTGAQAAEIAAKLEDTNCDKVLHPDPLPSFGQISPPVPAEVLREITRYVDAGCDCDGWPAHD